MVIATQNPIEQAGTYRLPEAQLDRFLMKVTLGYPDAEATEEMLMHADVRDRAALVRPVATAETITEMRTVADAVYVDRALISCVRRIAERSREMPEVRLGLSARACLALIRSAKAWAAASRARRTSCPRTSSCWRRRSWATDCCSPPRPRSAAPPSTRSPGSCSTRCRRPHDRG